MAAQIPAEDMVAALIILGDGATSAPLERAVRGVEAWQDSMDRHFGTWRHDVRSSLTTLWFDDEEVDARCTSAETVLTDLSLAEASPILLKYGSFFANDEGAYWLDRDISGGDDSLRGSGASPSTPSDRRTRMRQFFTQVTDRHPDQVLFFLRALGFGERSLVNWSRPGFSS